MEAFPSRRQVLRSIFSNQRYVLLAAVTATVFYGMNALIMQWNNLGLFTVQNAFSLLTVGAFYLTTRASFTGILAVSALTGVLVSLLVYRVRAMRTALPARGGLLSSAGILGGTMLPGCASCGIGLAAALGFGSGLAVLPLQGLEISLFAIALLIASIAMVAQSMTVHALCRVPRKKQ